MISLAVVGAAAALVGLRRVLMGAGVLSLVVTMLTVGVLLAITP